MVQYYSVPALLESCSHQIPNALAESFKSTTHLGSQICFLFVWLVLVLFIWVLFLLLFLFDFGSGGGGVVSGNMISCAFHCLQTVLPSLSFSVPVSTEICENVSH